ncbi:Pre-mRNA-splicing factor cwf19 [Trichophyton interdigitale]|uniref:Pre-mRNA-splicing factor cwf19 n=1 Tax=Trichophyton interdigitale TaxID=101480 RepID=A0A9P5CXE1_9EURO|nr:Pre-mRNA-splicing factor cwf19 [Trichophyton interdigitale]KAF3897820.1 Pre-mRNA-splicing factor cwf19 [Trichophyton interdigitale]KAG8209169.1 Pre-mRNA-splicing factor cwf19 [Trichophyton interdigitale]
MTLEDFERELAENNRKEKERDEREHERSRRRHRHRSDRDRDRDEDSKHRSHRHHHRHRSPHDRHGRREEDEDESERRRHKRSRHSTSNGEEREHQHKRRHRDRDRDRHRSRSADRDNTKEEPQEPAVEPETGAKLQRDSWMEGPSAQDIDYIHRPKEKPQETPAARMLQVDFGQKLHEKELNRHLLDVAEDADTTRKSDPVEVDYTFGDEGSQWRMTKLKAVYRQANESGKRVDEVALERYGDLRFFDNAREEEIELDRRERYGKDYLGKEKPSGELFKARKLDMEPTRRNDNAIPTSYRHSAQGKTVKTEPAPRETTALDASALNKLKAQMMKAKLRGASDAAELEARYNAVVSGAANRKEADVVVLGVMDNRMLAGGNRAEVCAVETKRGRERGQVEENEDMTIEDMVREERRNRGGAGEGQRFAERIAKDAKFDNDLDYMDENASKLAKRVHKSEINLKNASISEFQKMNRILDNCPLCHHEDTGKPPLAPVVSLATRVYLTLPTEPELNEGSTCIVPIQHRTNLLECDDDEWEEIRNFMKCLTMLYHDQGRDVIFYENAARPGQKRHAAMEVVPLPYSLGETAPAFFREAIISADEEWTQHKKVIDTLAKARQGGGKLAFRNTLAKEMPYFHVWFELDGGLGHVVEDPNRWPKGDLFAREIIGGMLDLGPEVIKRQGRWRSGTDRRVDGFKKRWKKFDWTRVLTEE